MPAFQLGPTSAALVSENQGMPQLTIVNLATAGVTIFGHDAVRQLRDACNLALDAAEAFTKPIPSQKTGGE